MATPAEMREKIFDLYSNQLLLLKQQGLLDVEFLSDQPYICPLCLREFNKTHLNVMLPNHLTLEDAPPKSLGGSAMVLTCKECNNTCGSMVDIHLFNAMKRNELRKFPIGVEQEMFFLKDGKRIRAKVTPTGDGKLTVFHSAKNNNPIDLKDFIENDIGKNKGGIINIFPLSLKILTERVEIALLKAGYILAFAKFGYLFLLDNFYNDIRRQILNPELEIFRYKLHKITDLPEQVYGANIIQERYFECICVCEELYYLGNSESFVYLLPIPRLPAKFLLREIVVREFGGKQLSVNLTILNRKEDFLRKTIDMKRFYKWVYRL